MNDIQAFEILNIEATASKREIRSAYAKLAQECHPEEQPEEFARLQEAYQLALKYLENESWQSVEEIKQIEPDIQTKSEETDFENPDEESKNMLLDAWQAGWEKEQKRRQNTGAMKELIAIFEERKMAQGNKPWVSFFLSDVFLKEYFEINFAEALDYYLEHQTVYDRTELPQGFLVELAIAYGMITEMDGCMYQAGEIPMRRIIAKYWNQQKEMWRLQRGMRILLREENKARMQAFSDYISLRTLERQGQLLEEKEEVWFSIVWHGEPAYLYEVSKGAYGEATSTTILRLFTYWISEGNMPLFMVQRMYQRYQLKGIEKSHYYSVYKELKEAMIHKYPQIEENEEQEAIKKWVYRLLEIESAFMARAAVRFVPETVEETEEIHKLFESEVWKQYWNHPFMMQWLLWKTHFHNIPLTIAQYLYDAYSSKERIENQNCRELREHSMGAMVNYRKSTEQTTLDFWEYLFMRGYGICTKEFLPEETEGEHLSDEGKKYICDNKLYLPAYIKTKYQSSYEWQKKFVGYNDETGQIDNPAFVEFTLPEGDVIKAEYHLHFIAYYRNGERKYRPFLSYDMFEAYQEKITKAEEFFLLLAVTEIAENDRQRARKLVLDWLPETRLIESTFSVIADCITQNNAADRDTEECAILENEAICLVLKKTARGMQLYEYTEMGLKPRAFRIGAAWEQYDMDTILKAHIKPAPKKITVFDTEGLEKEEKVKIILQGLLLYARHEKGAALTEPVLPKDYPELIPLFEKEMGWLTDSFVVLYRMLSPDNIRREILYISVDQWGCYSSYIKNEDIEKETQRVRELKDKVKRTKYESCIMEGRIIRDSSAGRSFSWTEPFLFGRNGKMYGSYGLARLCETESVEELLGKMLDVENVVKCEVFEGKMTVSNQTGQLEYCFTQEEYAEAKAAYEKDWEKAYAIVKAKAEETEPADENNIQKTYQKEMLERMTTIYLKEMDKVERYKDRCETLTEYYCIL